jgi:hypothetical protein
LGTWITRPLSAFATYPDHSLCQRYSKGVKIVFGVADVQSFKIANEKDGLKFGVIRKVDGLEFANARPGRQFDSDIQRGL